MEAEKIIGREGDKGGGGKGREGGWDLLRLTGVPYSQASKLK